PTFTSFNTLVVWVNLNNDQSREHGRCPEHEGYETEMEAHRERARASSKYGIDYNSLIKVDGKTDFTGYEHLVEHSTVTALFVEGRPVDAVTAGTEATVVLDRTSFYGERSEEHTSELQSRENLVCRLLLEKKK